MRDTPSTEIDKGRAIIIDDEELLLELGCEILEKVGLKVETYSNFRAASKAIEENREGIAIILSDNDTKEFTEEEVKSGTSIFGPQFLAQNRNALGPAVGLILMTGSGIDVQGENAKLFHDNNIDFLEKPFFLEDLQKLVRMRYMHWKSVVNKEQPVVV